MGYTSGERRGTIVLLIIVAAIIAGILLWRGCSKVDPAALPPGAVMPDTSAITDVTAVKTDSVGKSKADSLKKKKKPTEKKRGKGSAKRRGDASGHRREFLDEPVR